MNHTIDSQLKKTFIRFYNVKPIKFILKNNILCYFFSSILTKYFQDSEYNNFLFQYNFPF